ncbi:tetratricopeptide repeat protein [Carnobacterium funditum]|uniref:tetratricopeptide repeat protein n=1 Tax=Carnobacterium funditum TaxID=2752 RepID=UPI000550424B|nr:hypothetical protein [Carnobacterium funditum]
MKDTEIIVPQLEKFLVEHGDDFENEDEAIQAFIKQYNQQIKDPSLFEELSDKDRANSELEEIAYAQNDKEYKAIIRKVLKLDPDNLDARYYKLQLDVEKDTYLKDFKKLVDFGWELMQKEQLDNAESLGHYWLITKTRPFMRVKQAYADALLQFSRLTLAEEQYKELLQLNEGDNQGVRYNLMSVYYRLEKTVEAQELSEKYKYDQNSPLFLIPLILLSLKIGDEKTAKRYYNLLQKEHPYTSEIFKKKELDVEKALTMLESESYSPDSGEDIYLAIAMNIDVFMTAPTDLYYSWFKKNLKKSLPKK